MSAPRSHRRARLPRNRSSSESLDSEEDEDELLSVQATFNTLSLVHRDEGLMRFVKYVSHLAPSSRWDVAAQYTVEAVEDSDDESLHASEGLPEEEDEP